MGISTTKTIVVGTINCWIMVPDPDKLVIYEIDCRQMAADGYRFFESANHVWLTKEVPVKYLKKE